MVKKAWNDTARWWLIPLNEMYKTWAIEVAMELYFAGLLFEVVTAVKDHLTLGTTAFAVFLDFIKKYEVNLAIIELAIGSRISEFADAIAFTWACRPCYLEIIVTVICRYHLCVKLGGPGGRSTKASEGLNHTLRIDLAAAVKGVGGIVGSSLGGSLSGSVWKG